MKTLLLSLLGASVLLLTAQCAATPEKEAPVKYQSTPSARRTVQREPPPPLRTLISSVPRRLIRHFETFLNGRSC